jgi:hypothetical protein
MMGKYQTRPVIVEAVQFTSPQDASSLGVKKWPENRPHIMDGSWGYMDAATSRYPVWVNDWIVTRRNGEKAVYRPDDFEVMYEEVHP